MAGLPSKDAKEYRERLLEAQREMQAQYDQTLVTLTGGAFAVSAYFVKDLLGRNKAQWDWYLFIAWCAWSLSLSAVLTSYFTSARAMGAAVTKVDSGETDPQKICGGANSCTKFLNISSGVLFFGGIILFAIFAFNNL